MSEPVKALWQDDAALFKAICEYVANERLVDLWEAGLVRSLGGDEQQDFRNAARTLPERLPLATPEMVADKERLDWMERDHNARVFPSLGIGADGANWFGVRVEHEGGKGFSPNGKLREAIDVARAAGGAHGP